MIKMAICDDDIEFSQQEYKNINKIMKNDFSNISYELFEFNDGNALKEAYADTNYDIIFLDIEIGSENGFEIANELQKIHRNTNIVFITTHENLVYDSFEFRPLGFVRKRLFDKEFKRAMLRVIDMLIEENRIIEIGELKQKTMFMVNKIISICSNRHDLIVKLIDEEVLVRGKISVYIDELKKDGFIQINRGILINMQYISDITGNEITLYNDNKIMISRSHVQEAKTAYELYSIKKQRKGWI